MKEREPLFHELHLLSVSACHVQKEGYGEDQSEIHRHLQQVRTRTLPDLRGEEELLGTSEEGCPKGGCLNVKRQEINLWSSHCLVLASFCELKKKCVGFEIYKSAIGVDKVENLCSMLVNCTLGSDSKLHFFSKIQYIMRKTSFSYIQLACRE